MSDSIETDLPGFVYFLGRPSTGAVKIGFSNLPERRLGELQTGNDERLDLIGYVPGSKTLERRLHDYLSASRLMGEWFAPCDRLSGVLARLSSMLMRDADNLMKHADALEAWAAHKFGKAA